MSEGGRKAKKIGLTFVDGHVKPRFPTQQAYHKFVAAADAEKEETLAQSTVEEEDKSPAAVEGGTPTVVPSENYAVPKMPVTEEELLAVVPETGADWHWVEDAIGELPPDEVVDEAADEEITVPAPNTAEWTDNMKAATRKKRLSSGVAGSSGAPSGMPNVMGVDGGSKVGRFNDFQRNDYLVEQGILRGSDAPDLAMIDDTLLDEGDMRRLKREVKQMSEAEQEHQERLEPFLAKEREVEDGRFRAEQWVGLVTMGFAASILGGALERFHASNKIFNVITPFIRRKMSVWQHRAAIAHRTKGVSTTPKPNPKVLRTYGNGNFFTDWPNGALDNLVSYMEVAAFAKGAAVFHHGDISDDIYFIADGAVDIVVRSGKSQSRPKSKLHDNGVVVATKHRGEMFGEGAHFTREPRSASAVCMTDVTAFRVTREKFVLAAATIPSITFEYLRNCSLEQRAANIRSVFPLLTTQLQESPAFGCWHVAGLQELAGAFTPRLAIKGEQLFSPDDEDATVYFIVSGSVEHTFEDKGRSTKAVCTRGMCVGEEELVFGEARTSGALCLTTCELWCLDRATYLPLSMRNAICAVESRQIVNQRRADRLRKPAACEHLLTDPILHYLVPAAVLESAWRTAVPCVWSQGETICTERDTARTIYVVAAGTLYQRYGSEGPDAPDSEGVKVQRHVLVSEQPHHAFLIGPIEFGCARSNYLSSIRCTSQCQGWAIRISMMENELRMHHPHVMSAVRSHITFGIIMKHFMASSLESLNTESVPPYRAENRTGRWL